MPWNGRQDTEVNNLGFHVYREENGQRTRLNKGMIAGSAFMSGKGITTAGYSYSWTDTSVVRNQESGT